MNKYAKYVSIYIFLVLFITMICMVTHKIEIFFVLYNLYTRYQAVGKVAAEMGMGVS